AQAFFLSKQLFYLIQGTCTNLATLLVETSRSRTVTFSPFFLTMIVKLIKEITYGIMCTSFRTKTVGA
ncbi:hypothetical protein J7E51_29040, partial [Priestia megaterium]|nr:hypothetical protein [Priestia megaterium]